MSQLSSLRAALNKIEEWISSDLVDEPQHHLLIIDLDNTISCCRLLVDFLDARVSTIILKNDSTRNLRSKIRLVFQEKAGKDLQDSIQGQTSALTLLLTACNR